MNMKKILMRMQNVLHNISRGQSGSAMVVTAMALVVLMGFSALVVDLGTVYYETSKLQNALDSGALGAVRELPASSISSSRWAAAKSEAISLAAANHFTIGPADVQPVYEDGDSAKRIIGIRLNKSVEVQYSLARILGINSSMVTKSSTAELKSAGGITGAVPLCITADSLSAAITAHYTTNMVIKCTPKTTDINITEVGGWFGALRFDGTGASVYTELLAYGYIGALHVGQVLDMETGNMTGPTLDGFFTRFSMCTSGCTAESHEPDCPRVVYVPVVSTDPADPDIGNKQVKIVSFAAFFLESVGTASNPEIRASYLPEIVLSDMVSGASTEDFGVYVSRLTE